MGEGGGVAGSDCGLPSFGATLVGRKGLAASLGPGSPVRSRGTFQDILSQLVV